MTPDSCVFCAIARDTRGAEILFESDEVLVFRDLQPQAPVHLLAIPKEHFTTLNDATPETIAALYGAAQVVARQEGFADTGYRTVINVHRQGGQSVWHLHLHILAGRVMQWPPG